MTVERHSVEVLKTWRAEPGWTAITIELWPHHQQATVTMRDRDFDAAMRQFESAMKLTEAHRTDLVEYAKLRQGVMTELAAAIAQSDEAVIQGCAIAALWCVLNHPRDQGMIRLKMERIREQGLAPHFTLCRGPHRTFGIAVSDCYVDIRPDVERPVGRGTTIIEGRDL